MKIYVCVKQVPASNETLMDPVTHTIIREGSRSILNPFDAYAVEEAIRIREKTGGTITAFTMGIPAAEDTLRRVIAVGADDAVLLTDRAFAGADTLATSRTLAAAILQRGLPDLILCGRMATDGDTAQVGPMLAEHLGIPHISDVAEIEGMEKGACLVRKMTDDGYVRLRVGLPALLTVLKEMNIPRLPSVTGVLRGAAADIARLDGSSLCLPPDRTGLKGSATRVVSTGRPDTARQTVWLEGKPEEQARKLREALGWTEDGTWLSRKPEESRNTAGKPNNAGEGPAAAGGAGHQTGSSPDTWGCQGLPAGGIWVYCEQGPEGIRPVACELLGQAARLGREMHRPVTAVLVGGEEHAPELAARGAETVLLAEGIREAWPDEGRHAAALAELAEKYRPAILLMGATAFGRSLAPRLAARLGTGLTADCTGLETDPDSGLLRQTRPAFGGNLLATIICPERTPQMATVRPKVFPAPEPDPARPVHLLREPVGEGEAFFTFLERMPASEEIDIGAADILVSVGQGIGGAENIALAERLAHRLGGALSASRPLVDSGVMPYARQVGQTGKTVAPKVYLALGISGAIQHMAGVAARTVVAVNTDPDAPIFAGADYAVRCDCAAFLRAMLAEA